MNRPLLQDLGDLEVAFGRGGIDPARTRDLLQRCREFLRRYATLEDRLLGEVSFVVPEHLLTERPPEGPVEAVEGLARRERERLAWGGTGERDLTRLLDREGLKVYRPLFPEDAGLEGFFLFDHQVGPVFVADGGFTPEALNGIVARLYGHYLLDHDPYEIHLLLTGEGGGEARAVRARHFAASLLIDEADLRFYLGALGWTSGSPIGADMVRHLVAYFEVDARTVIARLLILTLITPDDVAALAVSLPGSLLGPRREEAPDPLAALPERFVRLALEGHARGIFTLTALVEHLECDLPAARQLADQFRLPPESEVPNARRS